MMKIVQFLLFVIISTSASFSSEFITNDAAEDLDPGLAIKKTCQQHLSWGHGGNARAFMQRLKLNGIALGCNIGNGSVGNVPSIFQRGPNGSFKQEMYQETQNAGLSPLILTDFSNARIVSKNSNIGFMRMTQYHFLKLVQHLIEKAKPCNEMEIKFHCVNNKDLNDSEYKKRLDGIEIKTSLNQLTESESESLDILNRFELLKGCFGDNRLAIPVKCDDKFNFDSNLKIAKHCLDWMKKIEARPKMNWNTGKALDPSLQETYLGQGRLY